MLMSNIFGRGKQIGKYEGSSLRLILPPFPNFNTLLLPIHISLPFTLCLIPCNFQNRGGGGGILEKIDPCNKDSRYHLYKRFNLQSIIQSILLSYLSLFIPFQILHASPSFWVQGNKISLTKKGKMKATDKFS